MSGFDGYGWRREVIASDLSKNARGVAHALEARMKNGSCFPGLRRIERDTRLSRHSVIEAIEELESGGWIVVDRRSGRRNTYRAMFPTGAVATPVQQLHRGGAEGAPELRNELQNGSRTEEALEPQPSRDTSRTTRNGSEPVDEIEDESAAASFAVSFTAEEEAEMDRHWEAAKQ
jgi:DNA-binding transcriptional MocR family regulator